MSKNHSKEEMLSDGKDIIIDSLLSQISEKSLMIAQMEAVIIQQGMRIEEMENNES